MKYTGLTYRPPFEANSLLLQVTRGYSHIGSIMVRWETGNSLSIIPEEDEFEIL